MLVQSSYYYDKNNTTRFEYDQRINLYRNYKVVYVIEGILNVITENNNYMLKKNDFLIIKPLTYNKINIDNSNNPKFFVLGIYFDIPPIVTPNSKAVIKKGIRYDYLKDSQYGKKYLSINSESNSIQKKYNEVEIPSGLILKFPVQDISKIEKINVRFYTGFSGTVSVYSREKDIQKSTKNRVSVSQYNLYNFTFSKESITTSKKIDELYLIFNIEEDGQFFLDSISFYKKLSTSLSRPTISLQQKGTHTDLTEKNILDKFEIINLENYPMLKKIITDYVTEYIENMTSGNTESANFDMLSHNYMEYFILCLDKVESKNNEENTNPKIKEIIQYINEHIGEKITLEKLESEFNYSMNHINKLFKNSLNIPVISYIKQKQLSLAMERILMGENPTEVYYKYGFKNYSNFYRAYVKMYKTSPSKTIKAPI